MTQMKKDEDVLAKALNDAYLAGFLATGEGWNGERPSIDFTENDVWIEQRDEALSTINLRISNQPPAMPSREEVVKAVSASVGGSYQLSDGRNFWIDHLAEREITRRAADAVLDLIKSKQERG